MSKSTSGGFNSRIAGFTFVPAYDPETVTQLELGFKGTARDGRLRYGVAIFDSDYEDMQVSANPPGSIATPLATTGLSSFRLAMPLSATSTLMRRALRSDAAAVAMPDASSMLTHADAHERSNNFLMFMVYLPWQ